MTAGDGDNPRALDAASAGGGGRAIAWAGAAAVGLLFGLLAWPVGWAAILAGWGRPGGAVVVGVVGIAVMCVISALIVRGFGGAVLAGIAAPVLGATVALVVLLAPEQAGAIWPGLVGGDPALALLLGGIVATVTAASGLRAARPVALSAAGVLVAAPFVLAAVTAVSGFAERAAALGVPYTLEGDRYEPLYIALGDGGSAAVYTLPDGGQIHVVSNASVDDDRDVDGLTLDGCDEQRFENGATRDRCTARGPGFTVTLSGDDGTEDALVEAFDHLRAMSDAAFYGEARRYVEFFPG
ncbi:hypothetical protein [Myceligenerans pegani]|uniref:Uncharacterized protein n=1 Tax=Myceligenerans pegani TaxID=2776917 RepID=A0ABR9MVU0_9MICO|nr:hypothetical protein [Myceligenerans sp. TRM 65318]MBE1875510.1 hypothetical protein [Myceligenerans sp. TRM 65318]MBE3017781.1 hypothetical protein [Myceligenerans sp. TRM 65318]